MIRNFYLNIRGGKLIDARRLIASYIAARKDGECRITVATGVDARDEKRSTRQNRYYWGCVVKMYLDAMLETGDNSIEKVREELHLPKLEDALHEVLLYRFAGCEVVDYDTGEIMRLPLRSKEMNTKEIGVYWDKVRIDAFDKYGVEIPLPPDNVFDDLMQQQIITK